MEHKNSHILSFGFVIIIFISSCKQLYDDEKSIKKILPDFGQIDALPIAENIK